MRVAICLFLVAGLAWATETRQTAASSEEGAIDPKADAALRKMSDYLSETGWAR